MTQTGRRLLVNPLTLEEGRYRMDLEHFAQCAADGAKKRTLKPKSDHQGAERRHQRGQVHPQRIEGWGKGRSGRGHSPKNAFNSPTDSAP